MTYQPGVKDTSRAAHEANEPVFKTMNDRILHNMRHGLTRTRAEIAAALDISTSTMSGRINDLLQTGKLVEADGRFTCAVTGNRVRGVRLP